MLNPTLLLFPPTLILEETTNERPCLMHCTHDLIDPWGQATPAWYLRHGRPLPSPATCCAMHRPAEGLPSSCTELSGNTGMAGWFSALFAKISFPKVFYFLSGLFNLHKELVDNSRQHRCERISNTLFLEDSIWANFVCWAVTQQNYFMSVEKIFWIQTFDGTDTTDIVAWYGKRKELLLVFPEAVTVRTCGDTLG